MYIALTFDDGYKEHLRIARYLAGRGIKLPSSLLPDLGST